MEFRLDHSVGSEPCRVLPLAVMDLKLFMPLPHSAGSTPSNLLLPTFLQDSPKRDSSIPD
jgi:hypothetical protein